MNLKAVVRTRRRVLYKDEDSDDDEDTQQARIGLFRRFRYVLVR